MGDDDVLTDDQLKSLRGEPPFEFGDSAYKAILSFRLDDLDAMLQRAYALGKASVDISWLNQALNEGDGTYRP